MRTKEIQIVGSLIAIGLMAFAVYNNWWAEPKPIEQIEPAFYVKVGDKAKDDIEIVLEVQTLTQDVPEEPVNELDLLARCVEAEAGNQSELGKRLVTDVILNRVDNPMYPDTITGVVNQNGQFAVVENGTINNPPSEATLRAVRQELNSRISNDIVYFQTGGYSNYGTPYERVGDHYFSTY